MNIFVYKFNRLNILNAIILVIKIKSIAKTRLLAIYFR